jgi:hypothetical protein
MPEAWIALILVPGRGGGIGGGRLHVVGFETPLGHCYLEKSEFYQVSLGRTPTATPLPDHVS